jgi:hypothetical protein
VYDGPRTARSAQLLWNPRAVFSDLPDGDGHDPGEFYAAAIYGSILAVAFIAIFREEHSKPGAVAVSVAGTMVVFWIAHVWSSLLGWRLHHREGVTFTVVRRIAWSEWPLLEAAVAPGVVLALGWLGVLDGDTAEDLALAVCIVQLFGWGLVVAQRTYRRWWIATVAGLFDGALGLVIVLLEIRVVH